MGKAEVQSKNPPVSDSESEGETVSAKPKKKKAKKVSRYTEKTERIDDMLKQNHSSMYTVVQTTVSCLGRDN